MSQPPFSRASLAAELRTNPSAAAAAIAAMRDDAEARLNASTTRVDDPAELTTLDVATFPDGAIAHTSAPRAAWVLARDLDLAPAAGLVLANGAHRWLRLAVADEGHQRAGAWYVSSDGDWKASGLAAGAPTTIAEVMRRLANRVTQQTRVNVLDDIEADVWLQADGPPAPAAWLEFSGAEGRTVLATGTVTAYTAPEPGAPGTRGELTASFSLAAHVGRKGRVTGGDLAGAEFFVIKSTSGGKAEISVPQLTPYFGDAVALAPGDPIVIEELPALDGKIEAVGSAMLNFDNLRLGTPGPHTISIVSDVLLANSCIIAALDIGGSPFGGSQLLNCYVENALRVYGGGGLTMFLGAVKAGAALRARERGQLDFDQVISFSRLYVHAQAVARVLSWLCVRDTAVAVRIEPGGVLDLTFEDGGGSVLWGEGIAAAGGSGRVVVHARGALIYDPASPPVVNGTGDAFLIGGDAKAVGDLPYTAANGAAVVTD